MSLPKMTNGRLYKYSLVGGYPLFYTDDNDNILCRDCAEEALQAEDPKDRPILCAVNWEDPTLFCDCGERIESAYAEEDS